MKLLLMRHGEASFNASVDAQWLITQDGSGSASVIEQSQNVIVPWHEFTGLWASPCVRAQQPASLLLQYYAHKKTQFKLTISGLHHPSW